MSVMKRQQETPQEDQAQRLARARATLSAAERSAARWGGRIDRTAWRPVTRSGRSEAPEPASSSLAGGAEDSGESGTRLPVPAPLSPLFPRQSLRAGSSVAVAGTATTSLLLSLAVAAAGEDAWCAIAGMPDLGLRAALDAGLDPQRLTLAPAQGDHQTQVLSALVDGVGVLVIGPDLDLAPALWRSLLGRARGADTLVLAANPPGRADLTLDSSTRSWAGLGRGSGRLRRRTLTVSSSGRGIAGQRQIDVLLPQVHGAIAAMPRTRVDVGVLTGAALEASSAAVPATLSPGASRLSLVPERRAG